MHIAICDDNIADRKQFERLLKKEADKRLSQTEPIFFDSYGNKEALISNPMQYDAFYIDICHTPNTSALDTVLELKEIGVKAPITMCCSDIDYTTLNFPEGTLYINKPIKEAELSKSLDMVIDLKINAPTLIELRGQSDTYYVLEKDIMYGHTEGRFVIVSLTDGRNLEVETTVSNLYAQIASNPLFVLANQKDLINCRYIRDMHGKKVTMLDGEIIKVSHLVVDYVTETFKTILNSKINLRKKDDSTPD